MNFSIWRYQRTVVSSTKGGKDDCTNGSAKWRGSTSLTTLLNPRDRRRRHRSGEVDVGAKDTVGLEEERERGGHSKTALCPTRSEQGRV